MKHLPEKAKKTIRLLKKTTEKIVDPRTSLKFKDHDLVLGSGTDPYI